MKIRKLLCVLIYITVLIGVCSINSFASDDVLESPDEAETVLERIGVLTTTSSDDNNGITRAEFADLIAKFFKASPSQKTYFLDVPKEYWAFGAISAVTEMGLLSVNETKTFEPERIITTAEACKILLNAAGYRPYVTAMGGYPAGYIATAEKFKILPDIADMNFLTRKEAIQLIYETTSIGIYSITQIEGMGTASYKVSDMTLMSEYHDVYFGEGIVASTEYESIDNLNEAGYGEMCINGEIYKVNENIKSHDFFADYTSFVYTRENKKDEGNIIFIEKKDNKYEEKCIFSENIKEYNQEKNAIVYYNNDINSETKNITVNKGITVVYNGRKTDRGFEEFILEFIEKKRMGYVRLLDYNNDGIYDSAVITAYVSYVLSNINSEKTQIYSLNEKDKKINLDDYMNVVVLDSYGEITEIPSALPCLVDIAESADKENIRIVIPSNTISGNITGIETDSILVDGVKYDKISAECKKDITSSAALNNKYNLFFNSFGYLCYIKKVTDNEFTAGFLCSVNWDNIEEKLNMRIYDEYGNMKSYELDNNIVLDGERYKTSREYCDILNAIPGTTGALPNNFFPEITRQIIRYILSGENKIKKIDTVNLMSKEKADNTLSKRYDGTVGLQYQYTPSRLGLDVLYNENRTKIFVVPKFSGASRNYSSKDTVDLYSTKKTFEHDKFYYPEVYNFDPDNPYEDILLFTEDSQNEVESVFMFSGISEIYDEDEDCVLKSISCYIEGKEVKYTAESDVDLNDLREGDVFRLETNQQGNKVTKVVKLFDAESMTFMNNSSNPYWYDGTYSPYGGTSYRGVTYQLTKGYAYEKKDGVLKWSYIYSNLEKGIIDEAAPIANLPVIIYDRSLSKDKIHIGTSEDIIDYKTGGDDSSVILYNCKRTSSRQIFVFKD